MLFDDTPSTSASSVSSHPSSISCRARCFMSGLIFRFTMVSRRCFKREFSLNTFISFNFFFVFTLNIFQHLQTRETLFSENPVGSCTYKSLRSIISAFRHIAFEHGVRRKLIKIGSCEVQWALLSYISQIKTRIKSEFPCLRYQNIYMSFIAITNTKIQHAIKPGARAIKTRYNIK